MRSHVVTGGGRGIGRAIVERLLADGDAVVVVELDPAAVAWVPAHPAGSRLAAVARVEEVAATVAFLLSEQASSVNGAVLPVDGGRAVLGRDPEVT